MASPQSLARLACSTCRRQKRRCTRERPTCELCRRARRRCQYPAEELLDGSGNENGSSTSRTSRETEATPSSTIAPSSSSSSSSSTGLQLQTQPVRRDAATMLFFLDSYLYGLSRSTVQRPAVELPPEGLQLLDDEAAVQRDVAIYFARIHPIFPIVSKLRLRLELAGRSRPADTLLLLLVMRLLCCTIEPGTIDYGTVALFYGCSKRCAAYLEASGLMSVRRLQACLLLAHHEIAQALYPAAYMTVGACARLGEMMGLHSRRGTVRIPRQRLSLVECEESDRLWWATVILDRFLNIGLEDRPFSCRDANPDENLPMDETAWETGESTVRPSLAVTSDVFVAAPPFARTCQAAHLLTRVLHHINSSPLGLHQDYATFYHEALQLNRILQAFTAAMWQELDDAASATDAASPASIALATALFPGFALSLSAQLSFYDVHACVEVDHPAASGLALQLEMQAIALEGVKGLVGKAAAFSRLVCQSLRDGRDHRNDYDDHSAVDPQRHTNTETGTHAHVETELRPIVSPLVSNSLYQLTKNLLLYYQETGRQDVLELLQDLKATLQHLGRLWPIADEYLTILDLDCLRTAV